MRHFVQVIFVGAALSLFTGCKPRQQAKQESSKAAAVDAALAPCAELSQRLRAQFGKDSDLCAFIERQSVRFNDENCREKLAHFEQQVTDLSKYQKAKTLISEPSQKSWQLEAPVVGPVSAPVVFVIFCDFEAPNCVRLSPIHNIIKNLHADRVRLVYRQFPLTKNEGAQVAAQASLAAAAQGKFWEYHDVLYSNAHDHSRPALERYANGIGLNMPEFKRALDEHTFKVDVDADKELGKGLFITELPAVFANGRQVSAPYGVVELQQIVDEAAARR